MGVDFFAIQKLRIHEDHQVCVRHFAKYGYSLDAPLHPERRGGVVLAWKLSKWSLQTMQFLSPKGLVGHVQGVLLDPCAHGAYFWVLFITQIHNT